MEVAHRLIQETVRGFYDIKSVIVMEALLVHHVLSDKDLVNLLGLPAKEVRASCAKLKEDHLIQESAHKIEGSREHRMFTQTLYYIHFTEAIDAIKWKLHSVHKKLEEDMDSQHNPHDYMCDQCGSRFKALDAASLYQPHMDQWVCDVCGHELREDDGPAPDDKNATNARMGELGAQTAGLVSALRQIDSLVIPENTFQSELANAISLPQASVGKPQQQTQDGERELPTASASRLPQPVQATFEVRITSEAENEQRLQAEKEHRQQLARENALPEWHMHSTVDKQWATIKSDPNTLKDAQKQQPATDSTSAVDNFFNKLKQDKPQEEEDDDDDDDDEFEDVDV